MSEFEVIAWYMGDNVFILHDVATGIIWTTIGDTATDKLVAVLERRN